MKRLAVVITVLLHACCLSAESAPPRAFHAEGEAMLGERRDAARRRYKFPKNSELFDNIVRDKATLEGEERAMPIFRSLVKHRVPDTELEESDGLSTPVIRWKIPVDKAATRAPYSAAISIVNAFKGRKILIREFEDLPTEERKRLVGELTGIADWDFYSERMTYYITYRKTTDTGTDGRETPVGRVAVLMWFKSSVIMLDLLVKGDDDEDMTFVAAWNLGVVWTETVMVRNAPR